MSITSTINYYRLYCIQEATFVYEWNTVAPTLCPNNHADRTIDPTQTIIVNSTDTNYSVIGQNSLRNFQYTSCVIDVPSMTPGTVYTQDFTWPMTLQLWSGEMFTSTDNIGDHVTVYIAPDTTVGTLTANANIGNTTITVTPSAVNNQLIINGIYLQLYDGVNSNDCGRVTSYNTTTNTITFQTPLTNSFAIGTLVYLEYILIDNLYLHRINDISHIALKGLQGKIIDPSTILRASYTNNNGNAKKLVFTVEFYYQ